MQFHHLNYELEYKFRGENKRVRKKVFLNLDDLNHYVEKNFSKLIAYRVIHREAYAVWCD